MPSFRRYAGTLAGGALGYITGGVRGGLFGAGLAYDYIPDPPARDYSLKTGSGKARFIGSAPVKTSPKMAQFPKRRKLPTGSAPGGNPRYGSAPAYKRKKPAKRAVRPRRRRAKRAAREAKKFVKNIVKKEIQCSENVGSYTKVYVGEIEPSVISPYKKVAVAATRVQANSAPYTVFGMSFTPNISKRLLDAASVLYNGKAKSCEVEAAGNFDFKGFKCNVVYSSYTLELYNYTDIPYEVDFLEVTNKYTTNTSFMDTAKELSDNKDWVSSAPYIAIAAGNQWDVQHGVEFGAIPGLSDKYSLKHNKKIVYPGKCHKYFTKRTGCVDIHKNVLTHTVGDAELGSFVKGEKQVMVVYSPVLHIQYSASNNSASHGSGLGSAEYGFLTKVTERFKIIEPDETPVANSGEVFEVFTDMPVLPTAVGQSFIDCGPSYTRQAVVT